MDRGVWLLQSIGSQSFRRDLATKQQAVASGCRVLPGVQRSPETMFLAVGLVQLRGCWCFFFN